MGGKIFTVCRDATQADKNLIYEGMKEYKNDWSFIGSSANSRTTYGDIDIALRYPNDDIQEDGILFLSEKLERLFDFEEMKIKNHTIYAKINGFQVDFNVIPFMSYSFVRKATTVSPYDPFKALYRNEILFAWLKYKMPFVLHSGTGPQINVFSRGRYDPFKGVLDCKYSYISEKTGRRLVNPVKLSERIVVWTFDDMIERLGIKKDSNKHQFDFLDILRHVVNIEYTSKVLEILGETINALNRKKKEVPQILIDTYNSQKDLINESSNRIWPNEPNASGSLGNDPMGEETVTR